MQPVYWPVILTAVHIWQTVGMNSIIYYASLMGLDESLIEAAQLDGANKWKQTLHVVIPHLVPVMVITTILGIGHLFSGDFGLFYQVTKDVGLLYPTTDIINTYTFRALAERGSGKVYGCGPVPVADRTDTGCNHKRYRAQDQPGQQYVLKARLM